MIHPLAHQQQRQAPAKGGKSNLPQPAASRSFAMRSILWMTFGCSITVAVLLTGWIVPGLAQTPESDTSVLTPEAINPQYEYNVKAAFLYSFGRYVTWPEDAFANMNTPFMLGICGEDHFGQVLDRIAQVKQIQGRRILIERMPTADQVKACHLLFISHSIPLEQQESIIRKLHGKSVLIVGETQGFIQRGGGINFFVNEGTVQFEINMAATREAHLMLDAKLIGLGKRPSDITAK